MLIISSKDTKPKFVKPLHLGEPLTQLKLLMMSLCQIRQPPTTPLSMGQMLAKRVILFSMSAHLQSFGNAETWFLINVYAAFFRLI